MLHWTVLKKNVQRVMLGSVAAYMVAAILFDWHALGWWWFAYWLAATLLAAVLVGIPNGLITGWLSLDDGRQVPLSRRIVLLTWVFWLTGAALISWFTGMLVAGWIE